MYHYEILEGSTVGAAASVAGAMSAEEAISAAMDHLTTIHIKTWPVDIDVYEAPVGAYPEQRVSAGWRIVYKEDVKRHALGEIDWHSRPEVQAQLKAAISDYDRCKDLWERGLLTPGDFAKEMVSVWTDADYKIRSML